MYGRFFILFALILTGYLFRKYNVIDDAMNHGLNKFIIYMAFPCLIVESLGNLEMRKDLVPDFLLTMIFSLILLIVYAGYGAFYCKIRKFPTGVACVTQLSIACPNNGYMGFPIALIFFGEEGLLLMIAHNAAMSLFVFTYGIYTLRRVGTRTTQMGINGVLYAVGKLLMNPNIWGVVVGLLLCTLDIQIPALVNEYLTYIGNVATPMVMVFIGSKLTSCSMKETIRNKVVIESSVNRLLIVPAITYLILKLISVSPTISAILFLASCLPVATVVAMLAEQEGQDAILASKEMLFSTVLSLATIPLILLLW